MKFDKLFGTVVLLMTDPIRAWRYFGRKSSCKGMLVDFLYPESKNPGVWETPGFGVQDAAEFAAG